MGVVVEGVGFISGLDGAVHAVHRHVHLAELGVVFHLLLAVVGHGIHGVTAVLAHIVASGDEHAARTAGGVQHDATLWLDDVHDHADEGLGREEDAVIAGHGGCELAQEVLVDAADDVIALFVERLMVEDTQRVAQKVAAEVIVGFGQDARKLRVLPLESPHSVVHLGGDVRFALGKVQQVVVASLFRDEHGTTTGVVGRLDGKLAPRSRSTFGTDFFVNPLEAPPSITQEDQAQHGHAVLLAGEL